MKKERVNLKKFISVSKDIEKFSSYKPDMMQKFYFNIREQKTRMKEQNM